MFQTKYDVMSHYPDHSSYGVIEGYYGRPWTLRQRLFMIDQLANAGLDSYMIAPKFDLHHRWNWRDAYPEEKLSEFRELCRKGRSRSVSVILSLSPGLTATANDPDLMIQRFSELAALEPGGLALLMDDIPYEQADPESHAGILRDLMEKVTPIHRMDWFFCPTAYSGWHLNSWPGAKPYLDRLGALLPAGCRLFWTGESIIPRTIESSHLEWITRVAGRKPVIWDNFPANDYVPANSFFPGPLSGRAAGLIQSTSGLMVNPSEIFSASRMSVLTLGEWFQNPESYDPERAFHSAIRDLTRDPDSRQVLTDLFGYFYTPFDISPEWNALLNRVFEFCQNPGTVSPRGDLANVRKRLRSESNIFNMEELWTELYPFVRTLLGDLDYLIGLCDRIESGKLLMEALPERDPRWSTPCNDLIHRLRSL